MLVYLVKVDLGAILFCLFSLVYSFLAGSIGEKIKYTFNHATTMAAPHFRCAWAICQTRSQFFSRMDFLLNVFGSLSSCRQETEKNSEKKRNKIPFRKLEMKQVCFGYSPEKRVLQNIDLCIHKGEKVAVVGRNGSGKTTLIKLLLRLYEPDAGKMKYNGRSAQEIAVDDYRNCFSAMFQDSAFMKPLWQRMLP